MKKITLLLIAVLLISIVSAEEWNVNTEMSFTLNQNAYSDNWSGAELGNISWVFNSHTRAGKRLSELFMWRNNLRLAFGQTHNQKIGLNNERSWQRPEKSTDKIDLESIITATFNEYVDPFFSVRWESQFLDLRDATKTRVINPMRFTESAGIIRNFIESEHQELSSRLGGAFRQFIDSAVDDVTYDGGIEFVADYRHILKEAGVNFNSKLILYQALYNSEEDTLNDDWKALDISWENTITTKLWSVINMTFNFDLIYDKEEDLKGQFKQSLGLGIAWQL